MKSDYEKPAITDEGRFETEALACNKTPGQGASNPSFCGTNFAAPQGNQEGCFLNPNTRSS